MERRALAEEAARATRQCRCRCHTPREELGGVGAELSEAREDAWPAVCVVSARRAVQGDSGALDVTHRVARGRAHTSWRLSKCSRRRRGPLGLRGGGDDGSARGHAASGERPQHQRRTPPDCGSVGGQRAHVPSVASNYHPDSRGGQCPRVVHQGGLPRGRPRQTRARGRAHKLGGLERITRALNVMRRRGLDDDDALVDHTRPACRDLIAG
mmetsp:Transcript_18261/g.51391  ORF Transcript_18261/g.51391 Transcript_18261/m.51391 type:complete len:212 (-) Transcript_18261:156-791(-)